MTLLLKGRANRKGLIRMDEMNGHTRVRTSKGADASTGKAAADNDDARRRLLREHRGRQQRGTAPGGYGLEKVAAAAAPGTIDPSQLSLRGVTRRQCALTSFDSEAHGDAVQYGCRLLTAAEGLHRGDYVRCVAPGEWRYRCLDACFGRMTTCARRTLPRAGSEAAAWAAANEVATSTEAQTSASCHSADVPQDANGAMPLELTLSSPRKYYSRDFFRGTRAIALTDRRGDRVERRPEHRDDRLAANAQNRHVRARCCNQHYGIPARSSSSFRVLGVVPLHVTVLDRAFAIEQRRQTVDE